MLLTKFVTFYDNPMLKD